MPSEVSVWNISIKNATVELRASPDGLTGPALLFTLSAKCCSYQCHPIAKTNQNIHHGQNFIFTYGKEQTLKNILAEIHLSGPNEQLFISKILAVSPSLVIQWAHHKKIRDRKIPARLLPICLPASAKKQQKHWVPHSIKALNCTLAWSFLSLMSFICHLICFSIFMQKDPLL